MPERVGMPCLFEQRGRPAFTLPKPKVLSIAPTSRALRASAHTLLTPPEHCEGRGVQPSTLFIQSSLGQECQAGQSLTTHSQLCFVFTLRSLPAPEKFGRGCQAALARCCIALRATSIQQAEGCFLTQYPCAAHTKPHPDFRVTIPIWSQMVGRSTWFTRLKSSYKHSINKGFS